MRRGPRETFKCAECGALDDDTAAQLRARRARNGGVLFCSAVCGNRGRRRFSEEVRKARDKESQKRSRKRLREDDPVRHRAMRRAEYGRRRVKILAKMKAAYDADPRKVLDAKLRRRYGAWAEPLIVLLQLEREIERHQKQEGVTL